MQLATGSLKALATRMTEDVRKVELCGAVCTQLLSALDYLDTKGLIHRDITPDNILYYQAPEKRFKFVLADFGIVSYQRHAEDNCGTFLYKAPELDPKYGRLRQSTKMDVWSLGVTLLAFRTNNAVPPSDAGNYDEVLAAVVNAPAPLPHLGAMFRIDPTRRASAAQILKTWYNGEGMTTDARKVPPIPKEEPEYQLPSQAPPTLSKESTPQSSVEYPYPRRALRSLTPLPVSVTKRCKCDT